MKEYIKVNGQSLPSPTGFSVKANDLDSENSTRSQGTGVLKRERIRHNIHEVDYSVDMITDQQLEFLQNVFAPEAINVEFWWGMTVNAKMYAASPQAEIMFYDKAAGVTYWSFSVSLTEY